MREQTPTIARSTRHPLQAVQTATAETKVSHCSFWPIDESNREEEPVLRCLPIDLGFPHGSRITGTSIPSRWQRSRVAACSGSLETATQRSSWFPALLHRKHRNVFLVRLTENERLVCKRERWIGQGPRSCSPLASTALNPTRFNTSRMLTTLRSSE
jgi:hypothetical protein